MKTKVIMQRDLDGMIVEQNSKTEMFNATLLANQFSSKYKVKKQVSDFMKYKNVKEFIGAMYDEYPDTLISVSKKGGVNQGTWMHPYLFIKFAMWLNPRFELKVIKFIYDELIKNRHLAGDNYNMLSSSGSRLKGYNYSEVAKAIQWIVFNKTGKGLRQQANQEQLKEISDIEEKLAFSIDMGYIKSYKHLLTSMRDIYRRKNDKF